MKGDNDEARGVEREKSRGRKEEVAGPIILGNTVRHPSDSTRETTEVLRSTVQTRGLLLLLLNPTTL